MASAGIDASNVDRDAPGAAAGRPGRLGPGAAGRAARPVRPRRAAIVVSDTMGRPWRNGLTDVALGAAGIGALRDYRGETDAYGNELQLTQMAVVDELAGAAELVKGKYDQVPVAVVRGFARPAAPARPTRGPVAGTRRRRTTCSPSVPPRRARPGLRAAAALSDVDEFADDAARRRRCCSPHWTPSRRWTGSPASWRCRSRPGRRRTPPGYWCRTRWPVPTRSRWPGQGRRAPAAQRAGLVPGTQCLAGRAAAVAGGPPAGPGRAGRARPRAPRRRPAP